GIFPLRVGKYVEIRNIHIVEKIIGVYKVFSCFAGKADDNIYTNTAVGHQRFYFGYPFAIQFPLITTAHFRQYFIAPGLQWHMEMWYKSFRLRHKLNDLIG